MHYIRNMKSVLILSTLFVTTSIHAQWVPNQELSAVNILTIAFQDTTLYAGTADSVYRSTDRGMHWEGLPASPTKVCAFAFRDSMIFAGSQDAAIGAMRSSDNGLSWEPINNGCQKPVSCLAFCDTALLRGDPTWGSAPYLYRSTDNGSSWAKGGPGSPVRSLIYRGSEIFLGTERSGVPYSADSGSTWTMPVWNCGLPYNPVSPEAVYALAVMDTTVFAATVTEGVFRSEDGIFWEGANSGINNGRVRAFAVSDSSLFAATTGGGIFLSTNRGHTWVPVNTGLQELNVQTLAVQGDTLLAGTITGLWMRPISEMVQSHDLSDVFPIHIGWGSSYSYVLKTNWNNTTNYTHGTIIDTGVVQLKVLDSLRVSDSVRTWSVRQTEHILHQEQTFNSTGLIDEQEWWIDSTSVISLSESLIGFHEIRANGKIWNFPRYGSQGMNRAYRYNYDTLYNIGVPETSDRALFDADRGMFSRDYHATRIFNPTGDTTLAIRIIGTPTGVSPSPAAPRRMAFELVGNYPNPFNPRTVVGSQLSVVGNVKLVIYDVLGREVKVLVNERRAAGYYEDAFDASGLASGIYVCRMTAGSFVQSRKMILMK